MRQVNVLGVIQPLELRGSQELKLVDTKSKQEKTDGSFVFQKNKSEVPIKNIAKFISDDGRMASESLNLTSILFNENDHFQSILKKVLEDFCSQNTTLQCTRYLDELKSERKVYDFFRKLCSKNKEILRDTENDPITRDDVKILYTNAVLEIEILNCIPLQNRNFLIKKDVANVENAKILKGITRFFLEHFSDLFQNNVPYFFLRKYLSTMYDLTRQVLQNNTYMSFILDTPYISERFYSACFLNMIFKDFIGCFKEENKKTGFFYQMINVLSQLKIILGRSFPAYDIFPCKNIFLENIEDILRQRESSIKRTRFVKRFNKKSDKEVRCLSEKLNKLYAGCQQNIISILRLNIQKEVKCLCEKFTQDRSQIKNFLKAYQKLKKPYQKLKRLMSFDSRNHSEVSLSSLSKPEEKERKMLIRPPYPEIYPGIQARILVVSDELGDLQEEMAKGNDYNIVKIKNHIEELSSGIDRLVNFLTNLKSSEADKISINIFVEKLHKIKEFYKKISEEWSVEKFLNISSIKNVIIEDKKLLSAYSELLGSQDNELTRKSSIALQENLTTTHKSAEAFPVAHKPAEVLLEVQVGEGVSWGLAEQAECKSSISLKEDSMSLFHISSLQHEGSSLGVDSLTQPEEIASLFSVEVDPKQKHGLGQESPQGLIEHGSTIVISSAEIRNTSVVVVDSPVGSISEKDVQYKADYKKLIKTLKNLQNRYTVLYESILETKYCFDTCFYKTSKNQTDTNNSNVMRSKKRFSKRHQVCGSLGLFRRAALKLSRMLRKLFLQSNRRIRFFFWTNFRKIRSFDSIDFAKDILSIKFINKKINKLKISEEMLFQRYSLIIQKKLSPEVETLLSYMNKNSIKENSLISLKELYEIAAALCAKITSIEKIYQESFLYPQVFIMGGILD